ncbi:hypothetical protein COOONC_12210 [Cooperia oncophora]
MVLEDHPAVPSLEAATAAMTAVVIERMTARSADIIEGKRMRGHDPMLVSRAVAPLCVWLSFI